MKIRILGLITVIAVLLLLAGCGALAFSGRLPDGSDCEMPPLGIDILLTEGVFAGFHGIVLNHQYLGDYAAITLQVSEDTFVIVEAPACWMEAVPAPRDAE